MEMENGKKASLAVVSNVKSTVSDKTLLSRVREDHNGPPTTIAQLNELPSNHVVRDEVFTLETT